MEILIGKFVLLYTQLLLKKLCHILTSNPAIFLEKRSRKRYRCTNLLGNNTHVAGLRIILLKCDDRYDKSL
jgi:hypothetical protein